MLYLSTVARQLYHYFPSNLTTTERLKANAVSMIAVTALSLSSSYRKGAYLGIKYFGYFMLAATINSLTDIFFIDLDESDDPEEHPYLENIIEPLVKTGCIIGIAQKMVEYGWKKYLPDPTFKMPFSSVAITIPIPLTDKEIFIESPFGKECKLSKCISVLSSTLLFAICSPKEDRIEEACRGIFLATIAAQHSSHVEGLKAALGADMAVRTVGNFVGELMEFIDS